MDKRSSLFGLFVAKKFYNIGFSTMVNADDSISSMDAQDRNCYLPEENDQGDTL
jgi:hypothetical protein